MIGYLWLRTRSAEAFKIKTRELAMPQGPDLERAILPMLRDPSIGMRLSREPLARRIDREDTNFVYVLCSHVLVRVLGLPNPLQGLQLAGLQAIRGPIEYSDESLDAPHCRGLDLLKHSGEQLSDRHAKEHLVGEGGP